MIISTLSRRSPVAGNTLVIVVVFVGIITLVLGSYLALTSNQNQSAVQSRYWNSALPLAEAGIEEALSQIYKNSGDYSADGWTAAGTNAYTKQRYLGNDYYNVSISGTPTTGITINATGFVQTVTYVDQGRHYGVDTRYVSRAVQVTAKQAGIPAPIGMVAKTTLDFTGSLTVDSYDSTDPTKSSTNAIATGMYDASKRGAEAFVGCTGPDNLALGGNNHIYGYAASGVGTLTPTAKGSSSIGDFSQLKGVQTGHATNNFAMSLPDVGAPFSSAAVPPAATGKIYGNDYDYVLKSGNYMTDTMPKLANIYVSNTSVLYLTGDISLGEVVLAPGATLDIYMGGPKMPYPALYNQLTNGTLTVAVSPWEVRLLGLNNCTWMGIAGGNGFVGIIYAPHLDIYASGGGSFYGAVTVNSFYVAGSAAFHSDLSLKNQPPMETFKILSWIEL